MMKYISAVLTLLMSCTIHANKVWINPADKNQLMHINQGGLNISNNSPHSVFMTSSRGSGHQAELVRAPRAIESTTGDSTRDATIECQQPLGVPTACATACAQGMFGWGTVACTGTTKTSYIVAGKTDFLNESARTQPQFTFLDTIDNRSTSTFMVATTSAPLYGLVQTGSKWSVSPNTIIGALSGSGESTLSLYNDMYVPLTTRTTGTPTISIGGQPYPITFISAIATNPDGRFTFEPGKRVHMANSQLALGSVNDVKSVQTIILIPQDPTATCQPWIFIGRYADATREHFVGFSILPNYGGCCVESCPIGDNTSQDQDYSESDESDTPACTPGPCKNDYAWPNNQLILGAPDFAGVITTGTLEHATFGRLKIVIQPTKELPDQSTNKPLGTLASLEIMPGFWWPGERDFTR